jgi:hypothetical protein
MTPLTIATPRALPLRGRAGAPARRLLPLLLLGLATSLPTPGAAQAPQDRGRSWSAGAGVGLGLDLKGGGQEVSSPGLATHAHVVWHRGSSPGIGLTWDGAWFDGPFARERRLLLAAVVQVQPDSAPVHLRVGPGLGMMTVVEVDLPKAGMPGGGLVAIGERGGWGLSGGLGARIEVGGAIVEPAANLLWQRAGGGDGAGVEAVTLTVGGRIVLSG